MNERLQGWRLALALLIPAAILAAAGFIAYGALSDDPEVATGSEQVEPTATAVAVTQPIDTSVADPTAIPAPTALTVPTVPAAPATPVPPETPTATPEPAATATSAPAPTSAPTGPAPTATPDPSIVTVSCVGTFPESIETGAEIGPLTAGTVPAEAATNYQFAWDLGNGTVVTNPNSGVISYADEGAYTVSVTGTNTSTQETVSANCGTITVTKAVQPFRVLCAVSLTNGDKPLAEAQASDSMTVTVTWTPAGTKLDLTYEFDTEDDLVLIPGATSGDSQANAFNNDSGEFSIFWRDPDSGETGLLSCPAYPGTLPPTGDPTPTPSGGTDTDKDGVADDFDNCPGVENADQANADGDADGDACDDDDDNDGRLDAFDNCPTVVNFDQVDSDFDGVGNACDPDSTNQADPTPTPTVSTDPTATPTPTATADTGA